MTNRYTALRRLAFSAILLAFPLNQAIAQDASAVAERLKALSAKQGVELGWSNVTGDASSMVIEGLTVRPAGDASAFSLGNVTLTGITEDSGGYRVATATTAPINSTSEGVTLELSEIVVTGLRIPAEDSDDPLAALSFYETASMASGAVKMADKTVFSMKDVSAEISPPAEGKPIDFTAGIASFTGDLSGITDPQARAVINAFGYQTLNGSYRSAGSWNLADGRLNVAQNAITVDNAGTFSFTFDFSGYTLDFIKQLQEIQQKMAAQPEGESSSAAEMEMLSLAQQLSLIGATMRFDDDSLTGKILDFVARQQGQKRQDIVNLAKAGLPFALMQMQLPDLATAIAPAINTFLDDPKSIEIKAAPAQPVPFTLIAGAAMANPNDPGAMAKAIWNMLGVTVTANQP